MMRINARLDLTYESKINDIVSQTKQNVTDVLKKAIDLYHREMKSESGNKIDLLLKSGFIGSAKKLDKNLSTHYKKELFAK